MDDALSLKINVLYKYVIGSRRRINPEIINTGLLRFTRNDGRDIIVKRGEIKKARSASAFIAGCDSARNKMNVLQPGAA